MPFIRRYDAVLRKLGRHIDGRASSKNSVRFLKDARRVFLISRNIIMTYQKYIAKGIESMEPRLQAKIQQTCSETSVSEQATLKCDVLNRAIGAI